MEKNCFTLNGRIYRIENGKLYDIAFRNQLVNEETYVYLNRPGQSNILVIADKVYLHKNDKYLEVNTAVICENKNFKYFRTDTPNLPESHVFYRTESGKYGLVGRTFTEIFENEVFKIGKKAYQLIKNDLVYMTECEEFERWKDRLEIHTGEPDYSEMFAYEKKCGQWTEVYHYVPGVLKPVTV